MFSLHDFASQGVNTYSLIIPNVFIGLLLRKTQQPVHRKWISTLYGLFLLKVFYREIFFPFILFIILTVVLMIISGPRRCHMVSGILTLSYSSVFRYVYSDTLMTKYVEVLLINAIVSAKLIGVGLDIHQTYKRNQAKRCNDNIDQKTINGFDYDYEIRPNFADLLHFVFCYVGLLPIIFYRYRTYDDFINRPFSRNSKYINDALKAILQIVVGFGFYLILHGNVLPIDYMNSQEYSNSSVLYKTMYGTMQGNMYRIFMLIIWPIGDLICATSGFGFYPVQGDAKPGHGPVKNYKQIVNLTEEDAKNQVYDFTAVKNYDIETEFKSPWIKKSLEAWNMTLQYFIYTIYKNVEENFSKDYKKYAFFITMLIDLIWHGVTLILCLDALYIAFYILSSRYHWKAYLCTKGWVRSIYSTLMWILRQYFFGMVFFIFSLYHEEDVYRYFKSVHYMPILLLILYAIIGLITLFCLRNKEKLKLFKKKI